MVTMGKSKARPDTTEEARLRELTTEARGAIQELREVQRSARALRDEITELLNTAVFAIVWAQLDEHLSAVTKEITEAGKNHTDAIMDEFRQVRGLLSGIPLKDFAAGKHPLQAISDTYQLGVRVIPEDQIRDFGAEVESFGGNGREIRGGEILRRLDVAAKTGMPIDPPPRSRAG